MTMTITLNLETQTKVERIPDFAQRLERFIDEQYALEQWRMQQLEAVEPAIAGAEGKGLAWQEGHWVATGELPADFDLQRFIEAQRKARCREISGQ